VFATVFLVAQAAAQHATVDITPGHVANSFSPVRALGAGVDRDPLNSVTTLFDSSHVGQMLSAGFGPVSYRLNTELSVQAWHWNPQGRWSDPAGRGYFVGDAASGGSIQRSFGYDLPHKAAALDDANPSTYWKSDPYLSSDFTKENNALHAQWIVVDLGAPMAVNAVKIAWVNPYAIRYRVQYWTGPDAIFDPANGQWQTFANGNVTRGKGGTVTLKLANATRNVEYVRVAMDMSSNSCDTHGSSDLRNCRGYAIGEIYVGKIDASGKFTDYVQHGTGNPTLVYCSSVDSWHTPADTATQDGEQPGFDLLYKSGLTRGIPVTIPVAMLYDNPDNAAAEISYLETRGYPIAYVELGEEPDGQFVLPEDDAALYVQWADAIHKVDPNIQLAGPVFQGVSSDIPIWPDAQGNTSWFTRFLNYLKAHGHLQDLNVMTFEHYPWDPANIAWTTLYHEPKQVTGIMQTWRNDGLPPNVPMDITEFNLSFDQSIRYMQPYAALWHADFTGTFLAAGGRAAYFYQYEPLPMYRGPGGWGTFGMFNVDTGFNVRQTSSEFFSAQLITQEWAQPVDLTHLVYPAATDIKDSAGHVLVTAYALQRPDGQWSVMLVNKDQFTPHSVAVNFHDANTNADRYFNGTVTSISFGSPNYTWIPNGANGMANPDGPAVTTSDSGGQGVMYTLPQASVVVLRGDVQ
jgi:hypothetical protein